MKKFAALAVVAMAFVACQPDTPETPKEYALEVTSETTMEFPAEGGEGVIDVEDHEPQSPFGEEGAGNIGDPFKIDIRCQKRHGETPFGR